MRDISNLDLSRYKLDKDSSKPKGRYTEDELWGYFESYHLGQADDIVVFETDKGYFIYHKCDDIDYTRDFLIRHSSGGLSCGVFGSYRTSDVFLFGIARDGVIDRLVYSDENGDSVEGEGTPYEKRVGLDLSLDSDGRLEHYINEETVFEYAKWFAGFDIENEDIKLLDIRVYSPCDYDSGLIPNAKEQVMSNMFKCNVEDIGIMVSHNTATKETTVSCENVVGDKECVIYCDTFQGLDMDDFFESVNRCISALAILDLNQSHKTMSSINDYKYALGNKKCNITMIVIDTERKFMASVLPIQKKGKKLKTGLLSVMTKGLITYDLGDYELSRIYDKCYKTLR